MNPKLMGGSPIKSNKPLMVHTGTNLDHSVEDYLNVVTANLNLIIGLFIIIGPTIIIFIISHFIRIGYIDAQY